MPDASGAAPLHREYVPPSESFRLSWRKAAGRFLPDRFHLLGLKAVPLDIPDWTRPAEGNARIFRSDALERLTVVHPAVPPALFLPVSGWLLWKGLAAGLGAGASAGLFMGGLLVWTFAEYALHRFAFHFVPRNRVEIVVSYFMHGIHHANPDDARRLVLPPVVSLTLAVPFYLIFKGALGALYPPALAGFFVGYVAYDMTHYAIHNLPYRGRWFNAVRKHHMLHHFATPERRFGVSSPLWDLVFRTHR